MNIKLIIGVVVIAIFVVWGATAFVETTLQYVSMEEAIRSKRTVQVMGKIDFDQVSYSEDGSRMEFAVYDVEAVDTVNAERMMVHYYGIVPGNFDQATSIVLKGKYTDEEAFVAETMLVKCPSKYQGEGGEYQDDAKHDEAVENIWSSL